MSRYIHMRLEAPLIAFGAPMVDNLGVIQDFPSTSAMTGLIANALGWSSSDQEIHQTLQDRLRFGVRLDRRATSRFVDFQTAKLGQADRGWTTRGTPEGRPGGGSAKYNSPHLRYRHVDADVCMSVLLRLDPAESDLTLEEVASALEYPARPLFLGRKHCLPSAGIFEGFVEADQLLSAIMRAPLLVPRSGLNKYLAFWPDHEGDYPHSTTFETTDRRDWLSGIHAGSSLWKRADIELTQTGVFS